jgi:hypothetical protein
MRVRIEDALEIEAGRVALLVRALFGLHGSEGAEKQVADVGENGGAAGSDAVFGHEGQKLGEEIVNLPGRFEAAETAGEDGNVHGVLLALQGERMALAEPGIGVGSEPAALASRGRTVLTPGQDAGNAGVAGFCSHFGPRK